MSFAGLCIAGPALADPGWYTDLRGGFTETENMSSHSSAANLFIDPKTGWTISGAVGYRFNSPLRVALQAGYEHANIRGSFQENVIPLVACGTTTPCLDPGVRGHISAPSLFAMAYYDIPMSERLKLSLGAGLGAQRLNMNAYTIGRLSNGTANRFTLVNDSDTVLAGRASAELAYNLSPRTDLTLGYTYTRTADASLAGQGAYVPFTFKDNMASHAFTVGARLAF
jgi:opacity protein-like surface antigen